MAEYIERESVYNTLKAMYCDECTDEKCQMCEYAKIMFVLDNLPIADVQSVKHGRWIYKGTVNSWDEMACSCCDAAFSTQDREQIFDWEFCPHCGTKMDMRKQ